MDGPLFGDLGSRAAVDAATLADCSLDPLHGACDALVVSGLLWLVLLRLLLVG